MAGSLGLTREQCASIANAFDVKEHFLQAPLTHEIERAHVIQSLNRRQAEERDTPVVRATHVQGLENRSRPGRSFWL